MLSTDPPDPQVFSIDALHLLDTMLERPTCSFDFVDEQPLAVRTSSHLLPLSYLISTFVQA